MGRPKLTIVTKREMGGQVTESTQVWSVDGSTLTVETSYARGHTEAGLQEVVVNELPVSRGGSRIQ